MGCGWERNGGERADHAIYSAIVREPRSIALWHQIPECHLDLDASVVSCVAQRGIAFAHISASMTQMLNT